MGLAPVNCLRAQPNNSGCSGGSSRLSRTEVALRSHWYELQLLLAVVGAISFGGVLAGEDMGGGVDPWEIA